jgi:hypothetical protein
LLKYITSARLPGNWHGTAYSFVLHWKEQVSYYEKVELEDIPPKQKLRMLKNTAADVTDLQSVERIEDQNIARGKSPLGWEEYLELLLSACSDYDKSHNTERPAQRNIYATNITYNVDYDYQYEDTPHGVGTDTMEIYANATHTTSPGSTSPFIPSEQWLQLTQEQRDAILDKRCKTSGNPPGGRIPSSQPVRRVNAHLLEDHVNLDDIIEYTFNTHLVHEVSNEVDTTEQPDMLLAHMSGQSPSPDGTSPGDILHVLAAKRGNVNNNETYTNPDTLTVCDCTYLNKGETITFQGHQYFTYSTFVQYCIGQHEFTASDMA